MVMEVSSHGLAQNRVIACDFDVGIISNVTHDHFDFHRNYQSYLESKALLFEYLGRDREAKSRLKFAVANADDASYDFIVSKAAVPVLSYSIYGPSDIRASNIELKSNGSSFEIKVGGKKYKFFLKLPGLFNIYNALSAIAYAWGRNYQFEGVQSALAEVQRVPGRCQRVDEGQDFEVIVDFAHNPDGLKNILTFAPKIPETKRIIVFGCEGGKDKTKRQIMGYIAGMLADFTIVTMDNLYSEEPLEVVQQIEKGLLEAGRREGLDYIIILDRAEAIKEAIAMADSGDQVIIAGKGHETTQTIYKQVKPYVIGR
nr:UDP-N-acetylmuramyl-tripeptide synthetase [Desulforamulus aquiferis]